MATKTFYFKDAAASGSIFRSLQDGGSAPSNARTATGWNFGTLAAGQSCIQNANTEISRSDGQWGTTLQPVGNLPNNTIGDCWRSESPMNGDFANTTWALSVALQSTSRAFTGRCRIGYRLWKGPNANGSGASHIPNGGGRQVTAATTANLSTSSQTVITGTFPAVGSVLTLNNEYLFIQIGVEITSAGGNSTEDGELCVGSNCTLVTPDFTQNVTVNLTGIALPIVTGQLKINNLHFLLKNILASGSTAHRYLDDSGAGVGLVRTTTGWDAGVHAAGDSCIQNGNVVIAENNGQWGTTLQPTATAPSSIGDAWRSDAITGLISAGTWRFVFSVAVASADSDNYTGRLKLGFRLWKSTDPDGAGATEITSARVTTNATTEDLDYTITFYELPLVEASLGEVSLDNEYLFLQTGIEITSAGTLNGIGVVLCVGTTHAYVDTPLFGELSPDRTVNLTGQSLPAVSGTLGKEFVITATGISLPISTGTIVYQEVQDITLNLTGTALAITAGTLGKSFDKTLTGQALPASPGTLVYNLPITLTGVACAIAAGSLAPQFTVALAGLALPGTAGNLAPAFDVALLGASVPLSTGTLVYQEQGGGNITLTLTGSAAGMVLGNLAPVAAVTVSGLALPVAAGVLGPQAARTLSGAALPVALGVLGPGVARTLAGAACAVVPGVLTPVLSRTLAGVSLGIVAGTVSPAASLALVGLAAAVATGTLTAQVDANITLTLSGLALPAAPGSLAPVSTLTLGGASVTATAGVLLAQIARALQGLPITTAAGQLLHEHGITLTGQSIPVDNGALGPGITLVLTGEFAQTAIGQLIVEGLLTSNSHFVIVADARDTDIEAAARDADYIASTRNRTFQ